MDKGVSIESLITDLSSEGRGIARCDGMAVFVPGTVPGDLVRIEVTGLSRNHAQGKVIKLIRPSPDRIKPPCRFAYKCGGCSLQFMSYSAQLKIGRASCRERV